MQRALDAGPKAASCPFHVSSDLKPAPAPAPAPKIDKPPPPRVSSRIPVFGTSLAMLRDPAGFFVDAYAKYGPVFRARLAQVDYTILAGSEAREFFLEKREQ